MATHRSLLLTFSIIFTLGCGGGTQATMPDESGDLAVGTAPTPAPRHLTGTAPAGPELGGTQWQWLESHCTEGPLDLASQGFQNTLRISSDAQGLVLTHDMRIDAAECSLTLVQRALPGATPDSTWTLESAAHIDVPADCGIRRDPDRPGDLRMRGSFLEVYVQRSNWCGGLELKMVFARENPTLLSGDQLVRRYVAGFNQRDAAGVANLFAVSGSLVEPFTVSATGTTRHEGRTSVLRWYLDAFSGTPWLAMKLRAIEPGTGPGQFVASWEYMDPRLEEAMAGENLFTVAAGEIFETEIRLAGPSPEATSEDGEGEASPAGADASDSEG